MTLIEEIIMTHPLIPKEVSPLNTSRETQATHSLNSWIPVGRVSDKEDLTGSEMQPTLTRINPPATVLEMARVPPRKELSPLSKRDMRLPWNASWGLSLIHI